MRKTIKLILAAVMLIAIIFSASSCDSLNLGTGSSGSDGKVDNELFLTKTSKELVNMTTDMCKSFKTEGTPFELSMNLIFSEEENKRITFLVQYGDGKFNYYSNDYEGRLSLREDVQFKDGVIYFETIGGERSSYDTDFETADKFLYEGTRLKYIAAGLPENIPDGWFDSFKLLPSLDNTEPYYIYAENLTAEEHPMYSSFFEAGVDCKLFFRGDGYLNRIQLDNVTVDGKRANLEVIFNWSYGGEIIEWGDFRFPNQGQFEGVCEGIGSLERDKHRHFPADYVKENEITPTCSSQGSYDMVQYCNWPGCNLEMYRYSVSVDTIPHEFGDWQQESDFYPIEECPCRLYQDYAQTCAVCGYKEYTFNTKESHTIGEYVPSENIYGIPECQFAPEYTAHCICDCQFCAYISDSKPGEAPGHTYEKGKCIHCGEADPDYVEEPPTANEYFIFTLLDNGTYRISANPDAVLPERVIIPKTYNDAKVTELGSLAGQDIRSLVISKNIKFIDYSFLGDSHNLETVEVEVGNAIYYSENNCIIRGESKSLFLGCGESILPSYLTFIESCAFKGCKSIDKIVIPNGVYSIGSDVFMGCSNLDEIYIPASVTTIYSNAFLGCENITIYCEASARPEKWDDNWCDLSAVQNGSAVIVWGYSTESLIPEDGES